MIHGYGASRYQFSGPRIWFSSFTTLEWSQDASWAIRIGNFQEKKINRPKTTQNPHASEILTLTYHYFFFDRIFTGFSQVWKGMQRFFCLSPCFLPGPQNPATLWKLKQVRPGGRFCLGGVMSVWYRSILFEYFKWFAWWKSDGGFWMAYPFWQYYKARVELALPISSSETGPAGTTAFDALLFSVRSIFWVVRCCGRTFSYFLPWLSMYFLFSHVHSFGFCFKVFGGDCCFNMIEGLKKIPLGLGYLQENWYFIGLAA